MKNIIFSIAFFTALTSFSAAHASDEIQIQCVAAATVSASDIKAGSTMAELLAHNYFFQDLASARKNCQINNRDCVIEISSQNIEIAYRLSSDGSYIEVTDKVSGQTVTNRSSTLDTSSRAANHTEIKNAKGGLIGNPRAFQIDVECYSVL